MTAEWKGPTLVVVWGRVGGGGGGGEGKYPFLGGVHS